MACSIGEDNLMEGYRLSHRVLPKRVSIPMMVCCGRVWRKEKTNKSAPGLADCLLAALLYFVGRQAIYLIGRFPKSLKSRVLRLTVH